MLFVRTLVLLGCAVCLMAQSDAPQSGAQQPDTSQPETSQAEPASGEEYSGPAILSRGETPTQQAAVPIGFRPYIGLSGTYATGYIPVSASATGQIPTSDLAGVQLNVGAYTYRAWQHTTLGLDYRGDFREYTDSSQDATDQFLSLILTHRPNKRVTFTLRNQTGIYSLNSFSLNAPLTGVNSSYLQLPLSEIYDDRVIFLGTSADLTYRLSRRLSFSLGGGGTLVRRQSTSLYGSTSAVARGDLEYRISRHSTLGVDYKFSFYDYTRGFGTTDTQSVGVNYSTQFSRHLQFSARIGGARTESTSLTSVTLPPAIAALLGETTAIQAAYHLSYVPDSEARLTETFSHSTFALEYVDQVTPGNGVFLASRNNSANVSYSYTGLRHWNIGVNGSYGRMTALVQSLGAYTTYSGGAGLTRELRRGLNAVMRVDVIHYDVGTGAGAGFLHNEYRGSLGFNFSPGDVPLVLW